MLLITSYIGKIEKKKKKKWQLLSHTAFQVTKTLQQIDVNWMLLLSLITVYKKCNKSFKWLNLCECVDRIYW